MGFFPDLLFLVFFSPIELLRKLAYINRILIILLLFVTLLYSIKKKICFFFAPLLLKSHTMAAKIELSINSFVPILWASDKHMILLLLLLLFPFSSLWIFSLWFCSCVPLIRIRNQQQFTFTVFFISFNANG